MRKKVYIIIMLGTLVLLFLVNPEYSVLLPKCPFYMLTGWECPACGSQRAIHQLLHLNPGKALSYNFFLLISMPYFLALVVTKWFDPKDKLLRLKNFCNHPRTVQIYLILIVVWWVGRNIM